MYVHVSEIASRGEMYEEEMRLSSRYRLYFTTTP